MDATLQLTSALSLKVILQDKMPYKQYKIIKRRKQCLKWSFLILVVLFGILGLYKYFTATDGGWYWYWGIYIVTIIITAFLILILRIWITPKEQALEIETLRKEYPKIFRYQSVNAGRKDLIPNTINAIRQNKFVEHCTNHAIPYKKDSLRLLEEMVKQRIKRKFYSYPFTRWTLQFGINIILSAIVGTLFSSIATIDEFKKYVALTALILGMFVYFAFILEDSFKWIIPSYIYRTKKYKTLLDTIAIAIERAPF